MTLLNDPVFIGLVVFIVVCIVAIAIGSYLHVNKPKFNPVFRRLSDGTVQMECTGFAGLQTKRTRLYYEQYKLGMEVFYQGERFKIVEFQEVDDPGLLKTERMIVAYLEKINF